MKTISRTSSHRRRKSRNHYKEKPLEVRSATLPFNPRRAKWGIGLGMAFLAIIALVALLQSVA
ncbi:MAG: hypothetical protein J0L94_04590 [Rhodothermia bacterium]|nr:hypothetical protein [Rhodothermia bacterium]